MNQSPEARVVGGTAVAGQQGGLGVVTRAHGNTYLVTGPSMRSGAPSTREFVIGQVYDKGPSPYKSLGTAFRTIVREEGARALYQVLQPQALMHHAYELT